MLEMHIYGFGEYQIFGDVTLATEREMGSCIKMTGLIFQVARVWGGGGDDDDDNDDDDDDDDDDGDDDSDD